MHICKKETEGYKILLNKTIDRIDKKYLLKDLKYMYYCKQNIFNCFSQVTLILTNDNHAAF